jgi:hypothetical protein
VTELKPISKESIPRALEKAERYRLLNEPFLAESICLDVIAVDPGNERAAVVFILALADQFAAGHEGGAKRATEAIAKLKRPYDRHYYTGIVAERRATALLHRGGYGVNAAAWHFIDDAMKAYERADALEDDPSNDDARLRFNTCVRLIQAHRLTEPHPEADTFPLE